MCLIVFIVHFIVMTALKREDRIGKMKENVSSLVYIVYFSSNRNIKAFINILFCFFKIWFALI